MSPSIGNSIIGDMPIGGRQVPVLDPDHVAVPTRLRVKPCQPEFHRAHWLVTWLVTIQPCPAPEPHVRDALWENKVIDGLGFSVVIKIGQPEEVVLFLMTPPKEEEMPLIGRVARSLSMFSRAQSAASMSSHTCASFPAG